MWRPRRNRAPGIVYTPAYMYTCNLHFHVDSDPPKLTRVDVVDIDQIKGQVIPIEITLIAS